MSQLRLAFDKFLFLFDMPPERVKCVVMGDQGVGKTCLLESYTTNSFPEGKVTNDYMNYASPVMLDGKYYVIDLHDTHSDPAYDRIRPLSFPNTNVFLVCFSITSQSSLEHISTIWVPEISQHQPNTPFILVGTKSDLRGDEELAQMKKLISREEGIEIAKQLGAWKYMECSAYTQEGLRDVIDEAVRAGEYQKAQQFQRRKHQCTIC